MIQIIQEGDPVLRNVAEDVSTDKILTPPIQKIITDMKKALSDQEDGVAIAAPQIGAPLNIFIVSKRAFMIDKNGKTIEFSDTEFAKLNDTVYINPKITNISKKKEWIQEGCLSVRFKYGKVKRAKKATVTAYNEKGVRFTRGGSGLLAQIFQHEIDHLNGILFIDKAKNIEVSPPNDN